ncbi:MAG: LamG domain-containing protein [Parvularculaceae bacterium]
MGLKSLLAFMGAGMLGLVAASLPALAQDETPAPADTYRPDIAEFAGADSIELAPNSSLFLYGDGTIEFWAVPDWKDDPGYDPVVISNAGPDGASYLVSILGDRTGVGVRSGESEGYAPFDFTDGLLHHIAVVSEEGLTKVYVDGALQGAFDMRFKPIGSEGVWIGSADGETAPFVGAIAQLRIWDSALTPEELVAYSQDNPFGGVDGEHPEIANLLAVSAFEDREVLIASDLDAEEGASDKDSAAAAPDGN